MCACVRIVEGWGPDVCVLGGAGPLHLCRRRGSKAGSAVPWAVGVGLLHCSTGFLGEVAQVRSNVYHQVSVNHEASGLMEWLVVDDWVAILCCRGSLTASTRRGCCPGQRCGWMRGRKPAARRGPAGLSAPLQGRGHSCRAWPSAMSC